MRSRGGYFWWTGLAWLLAAGLGLGVLGGCGDAPEPKSGEGDVSGKTPVVRPEDVHGRGGSGTAVLAPDYRRDLHPAEEAAEGGGNPLQADLGKARAKTGKPAPGAKEPPQAPSQGPSTPAPAASPPATGSVSTGTTTATATASAPAAGGATPATSASAGFPLADCRQLVLVVAADFEARRGVARRFVRDAAGAPWHEVGERVDCALGRGGLGLGRGVGPGFAGPSKKAGDGRTPAGLFPLTEAFGRAAIEQARVDGVRLPYQMVSDRVACVTDPSSSLFGRVVGPEARAAVRGGRQERMARGDGANAWGVVIGHNRENPDPEAGTCLFVNVRPAGGPPTGGSIGLPEAAAASLVAWLDPAAGPMLAVLPEREYQALRAGWGLP